MLLKTARTCVLLSGISIAMLSLSACSDAFDDDDDDAEIRSITIGSSTIAVGEERGIDVNFRFSDDDVFNDDDEVIIAILLPAAVAYVENSGEVDKVFDDDDVDPVVLNCEDGSSIIVFELDDDDLRGADDPSGSSDARLEFDIIGVSPIAGANIEGRADYNTTFLSCNATVVPQESLLIAVQG